MTLQDIVKDLNGIDDSLIIYAEGLPAWTVDSKTELLLPTKEQSVRGSKCPYFLEVSVAKDVVRAWSHMRNGRVPNLAQQCEAIIYYAENDAYILPEHEVGQ